MSENGAAKPEDFRKAFENREEVVRLVLPKCGLPVLARRLSPLRVLLTGKKMEEAKGLADAAARTMAFSDIMLASIQQILVQPRLSLTPTPNQIDPNLVPLEEGTFLFDWGLGLIGDDGKPFSDFFRARGEPAATSAGGGELPHQAERDAGIDGGSGNPT